MKLAVVNEKLIGKELATAIYTPLGILCLNKGALITDNDIKYLKRMNIPTVYINDNNNEIVLQEVINLQTRIKLMSKLKIEFDCIEKTKHFKPETIINIVDELIESVDLSENAFMFKNIAHVDDGMKLVCHSIDVAILSIIIGVHRKYDANKISNLGVGAILHDVGKLFSKSEDHPIIGYKLLKNEYLIKPTASICVLQHHENVDGTGFPSKLSGDKIYEFSKIVCICNEYINLYNSETSILPNEIMEKIQDETLLKFDPEIYKEFTEAIYCYPNGLTVELSDNTIATVVKQNKGFPLRPILISSESKPVQVVDLLNNLSLFIKKVII